MTDPTPMPVPGPGGPPPPPPPNPTPGVVDVRVGEYRMTVLRGGTPVAQAIRTAWGWNVDRGRNGRGERIWAAVDTRRQALVLLHTIAA